MDRAARFLIPSLPALLSRCACACALSFTLAGGSQSIDATLDLAHLN